MYTTLWLQVPSDFDSEAVRVALTKELEKILSPLGTHDNPAVSCLDIASCHGEQFAAGACGILFFLDLAHKTLHVLYTVLLFFSCPVHSGYYWIDPNEGSPKDAIRVFCKGSETCLTPHQQSNSQVHV